MPGKLNGNKVRYETQCTVLFIRIPHKNNRPVAIALKTSAVGGEHWGQSPLNTSQEKSARTSKRLCRCLVLRMLEGWQLQSRQRTRQARLWSPIDPNRIPCLRCSTRMQVVPQLRLGPNFPILEHP